MTQPRAVGDSNPQFNLEEVRFSPTTSGEYSGRIEGLTERVRPYISQLLAAGASGVFRCDRSPVATLEFTFGRMDQVNGAAGSLENPNLIWEFLGNEVEKDILEADIAVVNSLTANDKKLLRSMINGTTLNTTEQDSLSSNGALIFTDIQAGLRSVLISAPVLRVNKVVSNTYPVKASLTNVGRIISTATLSLQESIPNTILFNLPNDTTSKTNRGYGWKKKPPTVQASGVRFSINQEWSYGLWSTTIYGTIL